MKNKQTILSDFFDQVWNLGDTNAINTFLDSEVVTHGLDPKDKIHGLAAYTKFYDDFNKQFKNIHVILKEVLADDDMESARCTVVATERDSEKNVNFTGTCTVKIKNGKIVEAWNNFDFETMNKQLGKTNFQVVSYNTLRKAIGFTGLLLPIIVVLGGFISAGTDEVMPSISDYYFTTMGDVFVGCLCAVAFFLFCYRGAERKDNRAANLAAFFALCVALFPTSTDLPRMHLGLVRYEDISSAIHFTSAVLFFLTLAYFSIFLFTLSAGEMTLQKHKRNTVYKTCGYTILGCIVLLGIYFLMPTLENSCSQFKPVTILETVMLWAFGLSWLTKSEAILSDQESQ